MTRPIAIERRRLSGWPRPSTSSARSRTPSCSRPDAARGDLVRTLERIQFGVTVEPLAHEVRVGPWPARVRGRREADRPDDVQRNGAIAARAVGNDVLITGAGVFRDVKSELDFRIRPSTGVAIPLNTKIDIVSAVARFSHLPIAHLVPKRIPLGVRENYRPNVSPQVDRPSKETRPGRLITGESL